jgi:hypothetical protein
VIGLYLRTARHYRPSQIAARLRFGIESALRKRMPELGLRRYVAPDCLDRDERVMFFPAHKTGCELGREAENAARLQQGIFRFLNSENLLGFPVDWNPAGTTRLWRYNLHYFDYAIDLALLVRWQDDLVSAKLLGQILSQWIQANRIGEGVGWHSYPIARRIVNWVQAFSLAAQESIFDGRTKESEWLSSLYQQTRYLEDHLEFDCLGNHLLANGKALVFAGLFFGGETGRRWIDLGQRILWRGLGDQILDDGGHQERSPMYHAIVLQDYLEVLLAYQLNERPVPEWVRDRLILMTDFLDGVRHPDGEIPLFGDSALGIAHSPSDILATAERLLRMPGRWTGARPGLFCALLAPTPAGSTQMTSVPRRLSTSWCATGYVKLTGATPGDEMIVDTKPLGPPHLPAHGHCSLFSYELSIGGQRIIVDSGVEEYQPGPWRDFWRSSRAHNTVIVDGAQQTEMWGSFRAGERVQLLESRYRRTDGFSVFMGTHGGFAGQRRRTPHRRIIAAFRRGMWFILDEISGSGPHLVESLVHLVPKAQCSVSTSFATVSLDNIQLRIYPYAPATGDSASISFVRGSTNPIQGWYAAEFGKREANTVLSFSCNANLPLKLGYLIAPAELPIVSWSIEGNPSAVDTEFDILLRAPQEDKEHRLSIPRFGGCI